jgi:hypothetical protein
MANCSGHATRTAALNDDFLNGSFSEGQQEFSASGSGAFRPFNRILR